MADLDAPGLKLQKVYTGPDGNLSRHRFDITTNAAISTGDHLFLAPTPHGMDIHDVFIRSAVVTAGSLGSSDTMEFGLVQRDGAGSFADDPDKFRSAVRVDQAIGGAHSEASVKPFLVKHPNVFLAATMKGGAIAAAESINIFGYIDYEYVGTL